FVPEANVSKRILVLGCGSIGERHLRCLLKSGRASVLACDTNSALLSKIQKEYKVDGLSNYDEAMRSQALDGAVICTPAQTHIALALAAVRSGLSLLIENPL